MRQVENQALTEQNPSGVTKRFSVSEETSLCQPGLFRAGLWREAPTLPYD